MDPVYRKNVALILRRQTGEILVCERSDFENSWQFPQGGAKHEESALDALAREVSEEISLPTESYTVVDQKGPYRYLFRSGYRKEACDGQEQTYFLADLVEEAHHLICVDGLEFTRFKWVIPSSFQLTWVTPIKRDVYVQIFRDFFGVVLS